MSHPYFHGNGECEVCGHYAMEGIKEGVCKDCRDAYPEDYADLDADEAEFIATNAETREEDSHARQ